MEPNETIEDQRQAARSIASAALRHMLASGVAPEVAVGVFVATAVGVVVGAHGADVAADLLRQFADNLEAQAERHDKESLN